MADNKDRCDQIQESIHTFIDWAQDWQMLFNIRKCKVLGMGRNEENKDSIMQVAVLECVTQEKLA